MIEAYPLQWPEGWKRTTSRESAKFKATLYKSSTELLHEVKLMGGTMAVLSTNVRLRNDGLPISNQAAPQDPGAAIYFQRKGKPVSLACDRWRRVEDNIRALCLTIQAMRGLDRWGSSAVMERAFHGFTALPAPDGHGGHVTWQQRLGLVPGSHEAKEFSIVKQKRNELLRKYHPDFGSEPDSARMAEINEAFAQAERELA